MARVDHHGHGDESFLRKVEEDVVVLGTEEGGSAVFGAFDGVTSVLGVLVSLLGQKELVLVRACLGLALASSIGMGFGQYTGDKERRLISAVVIALATAVGTLLPVIGFIFFAKRMAVVIGTLAVIGLGILIGYQRSKSSPKRIAYGQTFLLLILATGVNVFVALFFPGASG